MTQEVLAERAGVSKTTISDLLNEKKNASRRTIGRLAKALEIPIPDQGRSPGRDQAVREAAHSRYDLRTHSGPAAVGRRRGPGEDGEAGERAAAVIASAIADVVRDVIHRNELHGTTTGRDALVQAIEAFAERVQTTEADVSELYRIALKIQRGELQ